MKTVRTIADLRATLAPERKAGRTIGLVPTMGAFHDGHLSLMRRSRAETDVVVVSLFVNPTQFRPGEDLSAYPRDEAADAAQAEALGVDVLFAPPAEEVYPPGFATEVRVGDDVTGPLEGATRGADHFHGVTTVVTKLFNMVGPDVAYFGQKDAQQVAVIRKLVRDLDLPVRVAVCPTVREPDGLAMSSRNRYLAGADRARAAALSRALRAAQDAVAAGERDATAIAATARARLAEQGVEPEYLELVSTDTLTPVDRVGDDGVLVAVAARVGPARLIDNTIIHANGRQ
jgi:pantoate--beta-alanine ligase